MALPTKEEFRERLAAAQDARAAEKREAARKEREVVYGYIRERQARDRKKARRLNRKSRTR